MKAYALTVDGTPFYVGVTERELPVRLAEHISDSKTGTGKKATAINSYQAIGMTISIKLLEDDCAKDAEYIWQERLLSDGHQLFNDKTGNYRETTVNEVQLRNSIQDWKRAKRKGKFRRSATLHK